MTVDLQRDGVAASVRMAATALRFSRPLGRAIIGDAVGEGRPAEADAPHRKRPTPIRALAELSSNPNLPELPTPTM
jgi:hypothetical protein